MALVSVFCSTGDRLLELAVLWSTPDTTPRSHQESVDLGADPLHAAVSKHRRHNSLGECQATCLSKTATNSGAVAWLLAHLRHIMLKLLLLTCSLP
jgi:hypothetical protein